MKWLIDKKYRKELLFLNIAGYLLRNYKKFGFSLSYALAVRKGLLEAHLSTGFKQFCKIPVLAKPLNLNKISVDVIKNKYLRTLLLPGLWVISLYFKRKISRPSNIYLEEITKPDEKLNSFFQLFEGKYKLIGSRNIDYMKWRYYQLQNRKYYIYQAKDNGIICGFLVLRKMKMKNYDTLAIVDIMFDENGNDIAKALFHKIQEMALSEKVDLISVLFNPMIPHYKYFKKYLFLKSGEYFNLIYHCGKEIKEKLNNLSQNDWFITWYDHDYV